MWVNGHEWAKRQAVHAGIEYTQLSNGLASCADPTGLQNLCDRLGPQNIQAFFDCWMARLPLPLDDYDRACGYWWELSMRQVEVSRTMVFDAPRNARAFFEALVADNLDVGRPDSVELIFTGPHPKGRRPILGCQPKTKIVTRDTDVTVNAFFKHSRIKQYLKDGRALRIETVVNSPTDLCCKRRLEHLDQLQGKARDINRRLLDSRSQRTAAAGTPGRGGVRARARPGPPGVGAEVSVRAPHRPHRCRGLARGGTIRIALGLSGCGDEGAPGTAAASVNSSGDRPTESDGIVAAYQEVDRLFQVVREGKSRADAAAAFGERVTK